MSFYRQHLRNPLSKKSGKVVIGLASLALSVPTSAGQIQAPTRQVNCSSPEQCRQIEAELERLLAQSGDRQANLQELMREVQHLSGKPPAHPDLAPFGVDSPSQGQSTKEDVALQALLSEARALMNGQSQTGPSPQALAALAAATARSSVATTPLAAARQALERAQQ